MWPFSLLKNKRASKDPRRTAKRPSSICRAFLRLELLENRLAPATFTIVDTFSGGIASAAGGTAQLLPFSTGLIVDSGFTNASGTDTTLRTGVNGVGNFVGSANANQVADTRTVDLAYVSGPLSATAKVLNGLLTFSSDDNTAASLIINYNGLTSPGGDPVVLVNNLISVKYSSDAASANLPVVLTINGTDLAPQFLAGGVTDVQITFDAAAFVGQQITSMKFTFNGASNAAADYSVDEITATFGTVAAKITISPTAVNEVDDEHTFTVTVYQDDGLAADQGGDGVTGFTPVGAGVPVTVTLTGSNGAVPNPSGPFNGVTNASGQFTVTFTSASAGLVSGHAQAEVNIGGIILNPQTNGEGGSSEPAVKRFVDAKIIITPSAVNEVGTNHTFTVTVYQDDGLAADQGGDGVTGFTPVGAGVPVTVTLTGSNGAVPNPSGPFAGVTNASGQFTVTFTSSTAGLVTGYATTNVTFQPLPDEENEVPVVVHRETDGTHGSSASAVKRFVEVKIIISPDGVNPVGAPHTFTVTVYQDDGLAADQGGDGVTGFTPVGAGVPVTVTLTGSGGAVPVPAGPFNGATNASGQFAVTFTSNTPGTVTGHASTTVTFQPIGDEQGGPAVVVRQTDGTHGSSRDATKTFVGNGGATATIGFWQNKNGQAVIKSAANIGNDLAALYPNLFGAGAAPFDLSNGGGKKKDAPPAVFMNLTGQSADNVAAYFLRIFNVTGPKAYAQVMANVLAAYFDSINNTSLAQKFGFGGNLLDTAITLTSSQAAALGLPTNTTVGAYLAKVNTLMAGKNGVIPSNLFLVFNDVSDMINNLNHI